MSRVDGSLTEPLRMTSLINLQGESVAYQQTVALKNITLQIDAGEKVAFIGPSGAGKTTLLQTLYDRIPEQSAFVHQHYALVPALSTFHNVYMGRLDRHSTLFNALNLIKPQKKILAEIQPILRTVGIADKVFDKVETLSGGQQQRVAIARAIYRGKPVLLADEPVSSVDPHQADAVLQLIIKQTDTVIMSLHAVSSALKFADRVIGLRDGQIQFDLPAGNVIPEMLQSLYENGSNTSAH